jgi:hypothetical protein
MLDDNHTSMPYTLFTFIIQIQISLPSCLFHSSHLINATTILLHLLPTSRQLQRHRFTPQPQCHECHPPSNSNTNAGNPRPRTTNDPTPWPFVVREVAYCDGVFLLNVGEEGALVVYFEVEDSVLVGEFEGGGVDG